MALKQVLDQEFGQETQAERAEGADDPLGFEEASEHILDLKGNAQVKTGFNEIICSFHYSFIYFSILFLIAGNLKPILG